MDTNQKHQFRQQSDNESNKPLAGKQTEDPQQEPVIPIPDEPTFPEQTDEKPDPNSPEPGINDQTGIDEETPIFSNY